jgi:hypothetical protein
MQHDTSRQSTPGNAMTPEQIVQRQLEAYNAHDLDAFCDTYAEDVEIIRLPDPAPALRGRDALRAFYASQRFNLPALHATIRQRMVLGNKVIDHEHVTGLDPQSREVVAIYEVIDGLIARVWFVAPE